MTVTGRGACPTLIRRENVFQSFQKKRPVTHTAFTARWSFVPQPLSKFILKAQSVYTWIRISLIGTVPPLPMFLTLVIDPTLFNHPNPFLKPSTFSAFAYNRTHFFLLLASGGSKAARMASSKTFLRPRWLENKNWKIRISSEMLPCVNKNPTERPTCVRAEHSTYLTALSSRASFSPLSGYRGRCLFFASFSMVLPSSRRSTCVPTNRNGVRGQWWEISGTHWQKQRHKSEVVLIAQLSYLSFTVLRLI